MPSAQYQVKDVGFILSPHLQDPFHLPLPWENPEVWNLICPNSQHSKKSVLDN